MVFCLGKLSDWWVSKKEWKHKGMGKQGRKRESSSRFARRKPSWEEGASDFDEMQKGLVVSTDI